MPLEDDSGVILTNAPAIVGGQALGPRLSFMKPRSHANSQMLREQMRVGIFPDATVK